MFRISLKFQAEWNAYTLYMKNYKFILTLHKTSLTPLYLSKCLYQLSQESEWSSICVLGVSILPLSTIFQLGFGNVPTALYFYFYLYCKIRMKGDI